MNTAPQQPRPQPAQRPEILIQLDKFWARVTEGLELNQLWAQFRADARASYRLYARDFKARIPERTHTKNWLHTVSELAWAILDKLTPARRVLVLLGVILLVIPGGGFRYHDGAGNLQVAELDFHFYGGVILFVLLMLEIADRVVMKRDLEIARDIQKWLIPAQPPDVPGLQIAFATRPANTVAGDFYDVFPRSSGGEEPQFLLAVADVAGKSIPAALLMATFQASLRTLSETHCSLLDLIAGMNRYACTNSQLGLRFTTAIVAEFNTQRRSLTYINAGHNAPIIRRTTGIVERLTNGGLPLGIQEDARYESGTVSLGSGDWIVIFTDGLVEAENLRAEEYGETRLLQLLEGAENMPPQVLLQRIMANLDTFVATTPQHDDVTCLVARVGA